MIPRGTNGQSIGVAGGDVQRIRNPHVFHQLGPPGLPALLNSVRLLPEQPSRDVAPDLAPDLAVALSWA